MKKLTKAQRRMIAEYLAVQFPWLKDSDADVDGADVVATLADLYQTLTEEN